VHAPALGWFSLAAALLATFLQWAATGMYRDVAVRVVAPSLAERETVVDAVARSLGDDARGRQEAEQQVMAAERDELEHDRPLTEVMQ
jgi:hypothetical protein